MWLQRGETEKGTPIWHPRFSNSVPIASGHSHAFSPSVADDAAERSYRTLSCRLPGQQSLSASHVPPHCPQARLVQMCIALPVAHDPSVRTVLPLTPVSPAIIPASDVWPVSMP